MLENIDCEKVIKEVRDYHKPWWAFHHDDLQKRLEVEGVSNVYMCFHILDKLKQNALYISIGH